MQSFTVLSSVLDFPVRGHEAVRVETVRDGIAVIVQLVMRRRFRDVGRLIPVDHLQTGGKRAGEGTCMDGVHVIRLGKSVQAHLPVAVEVGVTSKIVATTPPLFVIYEGRNPVNNIVAAGDTL